MKAAKHPTISAVVATYNRADYLRICLACLAAQDYGGKWQVIVADDGSTDHTPEVVAEARLNNKGLDIQHYWHEHRNYRRAFILNEGSRWATIFKLAKYYLLPWFRAERQEAKHSGLKSGDGGLRSNDR